jgi:diadenosine tetraphosphate (Ap4A) HIT family hydrolase
VAESQSTVTGTGCTACSGAWPSADHFLPSLGLSRVFLHDDQFFSGWTVLIFQRHVTELFHLARAERILLIEEVTLVAKVIALTYEARKINYELLGNQVPHIHWHLIPRLATDPAPLQPVWRVRHEPLPRSGPELQAEVKRLRQAIYDAH